MNVAEIVNVLLGVLIFFGVLLHLLGTIGLIRFPDVYNRMHAVSKSATLGVICVLFGATCFLWIAQGTLNIKLILAIFFVFLTSPVGGHLITRAAYRTNVPLCDTSIRDDLAPAIQKHAAPKNNDRSNELHMLE